MKNLIPTTIVLASLSLVALPACDSTSKMSPEDQMKLLKNDVDSTVTRCKDKFPSTKGEFS
jgi:hypothetical protein